LNNQNKPLVLELLAKHKTFTFLNLRLEREITNSGELDLTSLPVIYRLNVAGKFPKPFKLYCKVKEMTGSFGTGFKSIVDNGG
jgi:hypothetical protein